MEALRSLTRRAFLGAVGGLLACTPKRTLAGSLVGASAERGHRLRRGDLPEPSETRRAEIVIVGGGIAGLAAARALHHRDIAVLELEDHVGGNAWHGPGFPWGAHYVTTPTSEAHEVRALFDELGVMNELTQVADPAERLFIDGRWQEGLLPRVGASDVDRADYERFAAFVTELKQARGSDGRRAFTIPVDRSSTDPRFTALDTMSMATWLMQNGFRSEKLRWYVDYACRDDFGGTVDQVSAWAGIHYFAAREDDAVFTWPEGNGWLVDALRRPVAEHIHTGMIAFRVSPATTTVDAYDTRRGSSVRFEAAKVIVCTPVFVTARIVEGYAPAVKLERSPWVVANITVPRLPEGPGFAPAWDNVFYDSPSLGYVNAAHQRLDPARSPVVLTWYTALCDARRDEVLARTHAEWCSVVLADMRRAHPELAPQRIDVCVWGHGMVKPTPGLVTSAARRALAAPIGNVHFAHSDLSGLSLFEEAYTRGVQAAQAV